jgi:hypothetical protein
MPACKRRRSWGLAVWMLIATSAPAMAADERADDAMQRALAMALQARGTQAVTVLRGIDPSKLAKSDVATRACMLDRLGARKAPAIALGDPVLASILATYREYWLRSLRGERPLPDNEARLLARLNAIVTKAGGKAAASLDDLEPALDKLIGAHGYHALLGVTSPLRELMLWKTETESRYDVALPEGMQNVTVVFMDRFASLGWAGFATCDRQHTGGWTRPDRLYAVRSAYDVGSEDFRVSYLAHEGQHFSDSRRLPGLEQPDLEYRAKLVELAVGKASVYELLDAFAGNVGHDVSVPHSYANGRLVEDLGKRLFPGAKAPAWRDASIERINEAATDLLRADTARLQEAKDKPLR